MINVSPKYESQPAASSPPPRSFPRSKYTHPHRPLPLLSPLGDAIEHAQLFVCSPFLVSSSTFARPVDFPPIFERLT